MTKGPISLADALRERIELLEADAHQLVMKDYEAEAIHVLDKIIKLTDGRPEPEFQESLAEAMLSKGQQLTQLERDLDAIGLFNDIVERFGGRSEPALRLTVAEALSSKGFCYYMLGQLESEIAAYDEIILRNAHETASKWLMRLVSSAAGHKVASLCERDETVLALAATEEWLRILAQPDFYPVADERADAGFEKGVLLGKMGRPVEAIAAYDAVIAEFAGTTNPRLRFQVAKCLFNKAWGYGDLDSPDDEINAYRELIVRFAADSDDEMQVEVATAYVNLGYCLNLAGQSPEAVRCYDWVIAHHGKSTDHDMMVQVDKARTNREDVTKG